MADVSPGGTPDPPAPTLVEAGSLSPAAPPPDTAASHGPAALFHDPAALFHDPAAMLPAATRKTGWRRWLPIAAVVTFLAAASIGMLLFLGVDMGGTSLAVGLTAAVLPVPLLVASFLWLDRYEPEPIRYLAFCFAWGAAIATAVALVVNTSAAVLFDKIGLPDALVAVLVAPFIEELMKAAGPLLLFWRRRVEWSGITDGIVYCGLSALGFAMVENVLYLGKHGYATGVEEYGPATGLQNLFAIFIVRILFTGFAHPLFSAMTGIGLGLAARSGDRKVRWLAPIAGLLLAMILHGTFNLLPTLSVSLTQPLIMLYGYLGFMVPFFFAVVGFAIALRAWEGRLTERVLPFYVSRGWFSPPEVAALGSLGRRYSARQWARRVAGEAGQKAMKSFQFASTQLALLRDGMNRGLDRKPADIDRAAAEERRLLAEILQYRAVFTAKDPQAPQAFWDGHNYQIAFPDGLTRTVPPPAEPVVPLPIKTPQPAYAMGWPQPAYGAPSHPYGTAPASYNAPNPYAPYSSGPHLTAPTSGPYGVPSGPYNAPGPYGAPSQDGVPGQYSAPPGQPSAPAQPSTPPVQYNVLGQPSAAPGPYGTPGQPSAAPGPYGTPGQPSAAPGPYGTPGQPGGAPRPYSTPPGPYGGYVPQPGYAPLPPGYAPPAPGYGWPQPGQTPHPAQQASHPGYPAQPPYSAPPGYAPAQPGWGTPQGSQPGYAAHPGYAQQPDPGTQPSQNPPPSTPAQTGESSRPGQDTPGAQPDQPGTPTAGGENPPQQP